MSHIVLIEDDPIHAFIAQRILQKSNLVDQITLFYHGKEAYEGMLSLGDQLPDLILLDINMPVWDGWQFLQTFKSHPEWEHIPVYILTSSTDRADKDLADSLGVGDRYLVKPLTSVACQEILEKHLNQSS